jgi:hypothetical protein
MALTSPSETHLMVSGRDLTHHDSKGGSIFFFVLRIDRREKCKNFFHHDEDFLTRGDI